jgi:hypothetical protein
MEKYIENIQTVREIRGGVTGYIRKVRDEFREDNTRIQGNQLLTFEGKKEEHKKLQERYEKIFLGKMLEADDMINTLLDESKDEIEKVLTAELPLVADTQQKLFDMTVKNVEGKLAFALGTNQVFIALEDLLNAANEPLLAQQALEKFIPLSQTVLGLAANTEKTTVKQHLGALYQQLDARAQVDGASGAREALKTVNGLKGAGYVTGYVQDALKEISMNAYEYVNSPKAYFDKK